MERNGASSLSITPRSLTEACEYHQMSPLSSSQGSALTVMELEPSALSAGFVMSSDDPWENTSTTCGETPSDASSAISKAVSSLKTEDGDLKHSAPRQTHLMMPQSPELVKNLENAFRNLEQMPAVDNGGCSLTDVMTEVGSQLDSARSHCDLADVLLDATADAASAATLSKIPPIVVTTAPAQESESEVDLKLGAGESSGVASWRQIPKPRSDSVTTATPRDEMESISSARSSTGVAVDGEGRTSTDGSVGSADGVQGGSAADRSVQSSAESGDACDVDELKVEALVDNIVDLADISRPRVAIVARPVEVTDPVQAAVGFETETARLIRQIQERCEPAPRCAQRIRSSFGSSRFGSRAGSNASVGSGDHCLGTPRFEVVKDIESSPLRVRTAMPDSSDRSIKVGHVVYDASRGAHASDEFAKTQAQESGLLGRQSPQGAPPAKVVGSVIQKQRSPKEQERRSPHEQMQQKMAARRRLEERVDKTED
jgi:hypothetical protein